MANASVQVVENPNTDPVTVASNKVAYLKSRYAELDDEEAKTKDKLTKHEQWVKDIHDTIKNIKAERVTRQADVKAAQAELDQLKGA